MQIFYGATAGLGVCVEKGDTSVCLKLAYFYATISFIRAYKEKKQRDVHHINGRSETFTASRVAGGEIMTPGTKEK